jgi:MYXO-CTERM domain-containing protein
MNKMCFALALACAAGANAAIVATPSPIDDTTVFTPRSGVVFNSIPGPYQAFPAGGGVLGFDDYQSTMVNNGEEVQAFRFVGGVTTAGMMVQVQFYTENAILLSAFNVTLPQGGNFIWNVTGLGALNLTAAKDGFVQIVAQGQSTGQWFLTATPATVGSSDPTVGGAGGTFNHAFEIVTPTPGTMALLGAGGLVAIRRRRA